MDNTNTVIIENGEAEEDDSEYEYVYETDSEYEYETDEEDENENIGTSKNDNLNCQITKEKSSQSILPSFVKDPEPCTFHDDPQQWIKWMQEQVENEKNRKVLEMQRSNSDESDMNTETTETNNLSSVRQSESNDCIMYENYDGGTHSGLSNGVVTKSETNENKNNSLNCIDISDADRIKEKNMKLNTEKVCISFIDGNDEQKAIFEVNDTKCKLESTDIQYNISPNENVENENNDNTIENIENMNENVENTEYLNENADIVSKSDHLYKDSQSEKHEDLVEEIDRKNLTPDCKDKVNLEQSCENTINNTDLSNLKNDINEESYEGKEEMNVIKLMKQDSKDQILNTDFSKNLHEDKNNDTDLTNLERDRTIESNEDNNKPNVIELIKQTSVETPLKTEFNLHGLSEKLQQKLLLDKKRKAVRAAYSENTGNDTLRRRSNITKKMSRPTSMASDNGLDDMLSRIQKLREERKNILQDMTAIKTAFDTENGGEKNQSENIQIPDGLKKEKIEKVESSSFSESDIICFICNKHLGKLSKGSAMHLGLEDGDPVCPKTFNLTEESREKIRGIGSTKSFSIKEKLRLMYDLDLHKLESENSHNITDVNDFLTNIELQKEKDRDELSAIKSSAISEYTKNRKITPESNLVSKEKSILPPPRPPPPRPPLPHISLLSEKDLDEKDLEMSKNTKSIQLENFSVPENKTNITEKSMLSAIQNAEKLKEIQVLEDEDPPLSEKIFYQHIAPRVFNDKDVRNLIVDISNGNHTRKLRKVKTKDKSKPYIPTDIEVFCCSGQTSKIAEDNSEPQHSQSKEDLLHSKPDGKYENRNWNEKKEKSPLCHSSENKASLVNKFFANSSLPSPPPPPPNDENENKASLVNKFFSTSSLPSPPPPPPPNDENENKTLLVNKFFNTSSQPPPPPPPPPPPAPPSNQQVDLSGSSQSRIRKLSKNGKNNKVDSPNIKPSEINEGSKTRHISIDSSELKDLKPPSKLDLIAELKLSQKIVGKHKDRDYYGDSNMHKRRTVSERENLESSIVSSSHQVDENDSGKILAPPPPPPPPQSQFPPPPPPPPSQKSKSTTETPTISKEDLHAVYLKRSKEHPLLHKTLSEPGASSQDTKGDLISELKLSQKVGGINRLKAEQAKIQEETKKEKYEKFLSRFTMERFLPKIPTIDEDGYEISDWEREILAKQAAEKAKKEAIEIRNKQEEEFKSMSIPAWKKELLEKEEADKKRVSKQKKEREKERKKKLIMKLK